MKIYGWFGLLLLIVSEYCLFRKIEPFVSWFYCFAWWSYILLADNLLLRLRRRSFLVGKQREFWLMLPLSVFVWLIFEAYNFSLRNWAYDGVPSELWQRWPGYLLAFATVLPGILITSDLMELLFGASSGPTASESETVTTQFSSVPSGRFVVLGVILSAAPAIWPRYFFPVVWIGPIFLLDPLLERFGVQSLSLGISLGNRRRVWSLMLGGLFCGFVWEFWNYWAASKWVYMIPFFGEWKVFEMPLLGFLGFSPFALECWIMYHLLRAIARRLNPISAQVVFWLCLGILSVVILLGIDAHSVVRFA